MAAKPGLGSTGAVAVDPGSGSTQAVAANPGLGSTGVSNRRLLSGSTYTDS